MEGNYVIDTSSFVPAYFQLVEIIQAKIKDGEFEPGDKIESEKELSEKTGLSRTTVRKSLDILAKKGLIISQRGKGNFVSYLDVGNVTFKISDFKTHMQEQGIETSTYFLCIKKAEPDTTIKKLGLMGENIYLVKTLGYSKGDPIVIESRYMLMNGADLPNEETLKNRTFAQMVEIASGIKPIKSSVTIKAITLRAEEAELLKQQYGAAGFLIQQVLYKSDQTPVAAGIYIYRGDKFKFISSFSY